MTWWLIAVPLAVLADAVMDEDRRAAWVKRWDARPRRRSESRPSPVANHEHVAMLESGLAAARRRWGDHVEDGYMALADSDRKTIRRISRELERIPPSPDPVIWR